MKNENTRLPRGARPVAAAFLTALDAIPAHSRSDVAKAALGIVKEGLAQRKDAARQEAATAKTGKKPVVAKRMASPAAAKRAATSAASKVKSAPASKLSAGKPKLSVVPKTAAA